MKIKTKTIEESEIMKKESIKIEEVQKEDECGSLRLPLHALNLQSLPSIALWFSTKIRVEKWLKQ